ncbi:hypothetical protein B0A79_04440 [Flavobacterium piscis]|jgi:hypothetical protein|uniref:GNAT family N-acetyltransferase n=1 Tax=Flavobacterium piscis TaxID=1114874 RepID=A0ABX2XLV8_9FLAO|nr:hypothetical protein [Flavobacterium piscis]OCB76422.1 hypothetical protein FLP_06980 [Flavobacterium piscis]OXG06677.1 hypothetical protein B0A79_04440 [Flavobacterium piscis]
MSNKVQIEQSFIIDKLTDSILNTISGDSFQTEVSRITSVDLKNIIKKNGWNFNWKSEFNDIKKEVYKLTIVNNSNIIQGALSITIEEDHVYMNLLESSPFNVGKNKLYEGVSGNLVAFACKVSFQKGFDGFVAFTAKTNLIKHYEESLGAFHFKNQRMIIETEASKKLVKKYFKS